MNTTALTTNFNKATYLQERISSPIDVDLGRSHHAGEGWQKKSGLHLVAFQERLKGKGLSYNEFINLLENKNSPTINHSKWQDDLSEIMGMIERDLLVKNIQSAHIGIFVLPFTNYFVHKLTQYYSTQHVRNIDLTRFINSAEKYLFHELRQVSDKTVVLEFHKQKEQPSKSYHEFNLNDYIKSYLTDTEYLVDILTDYPVLARILTEITVRTIHNVKNLINRYSNDYLEIEEVFFEKEVVLESVSFGLGDPHKNGQTVAILSFQGGEALVYKPRSLAVDIAYHQFLEWINNQNTTIKLKNGKSLSFEEYGWQEFVSTEECKNKEEVHEYYFRMGANIAIFHLLRTNDMHYENIIAGGSVPYVIDLETLFSNSIYSEKILTYPRKELLKTVLSSGVLPTGHIFNSKIDFDPSALVGKPKQTSENMKGWVLVEDENDEVKYENRNFITSNEGHLVKMNNTVVNPVEYVPSIEQGFTEVYTLFLKNKEHLYEKITESFNDLEIRIVLRPTFMYSRFLVASHHPSYLSNGLDREELLEMLWNITKSEDRFYKIVDSEISDLLDNDIPYFTYQIDSKHLSNSRGELIPNVFDYTSLEMVKEQIESLNERNLQEQINLIKLTIYSNDITDKEANEVEGLPAVHPLKSAIMENSFLKEAEAIGDFLTEQVVSDENGEYASWIAAENVNGMYQLKTLDFSLYNGILGVSIFLGQLYNQVPKQIYKDTILKNIRYIHDTMQEVEGELVNSMFNGIGSIAYSLYYLSSLLENNELKNLGYEYLNMMMDLKNSNHIRKDSSGKIQEETQVDFMDGHAGIITFAVNLYETQGEELALEIAKKYGEDLMKILMEHNHPKLLGLAHGTSGIILALDKLGRLLQDERMLLISKRLIEYEDSHFNAESLNWSDLRDNVSNQNQSYYWCHGAPGILLSRSSIKQTLIQNNVSETKLIKNIIGNQLDIGRLGICHGTFGNLDILISLTEKYPELLSTEYVSKLMKSHMGKKETRLKLQGLKDRGLFGLMIGVSGVGYALLRMHNPDQVPSILSLDLPKGRLK